MNALKIVSALLLATTLAACGGADPVTEPPVVNPPGNPGPINPGPINPSQPTPYTMKGIVKNAQGQPLAGVEVWADNTLFYNMNALGTTDAQGRYSISLPQNELGTWRAGGRFKTKYNDRLYDLPLEVDHKTVFATAEGAIRNFTLRISGETPSGGRYGGVVYPYYSPLGGDYDTERVEYTLTPDGPLLDGSTGQVLTAFADSVTLRDVPIGRYKVTARYVPLNGSVQNMHLAQSGEDPSPSITIMFREVVDYRNFADFSVSLDSRP